MTIQDTSVRPAGVPFIVQWGPIIAGALAAGCAAMVSSDKHYADQALAVMKASFMSRVWPPTRV